MGKCLSCCPDSDRPLQNGHACNTTTVTKSLPGGLPSQGIPLNKDRSGSLPGQGGTTMEVAPRHSISEERRLLTPYAKLPPIRKPASIEAKRTSLTSKDFSELKVVSLFEHYRDTEDSMLAEGIERFCQDLEVRPDEFRVLVLAWKLEADTMCCFTHSQFLSGCKKLQTDTVRGIQLRFPDMLAEVQNKQTFKDLYRWTYKFGLDTETGQRTLPVDMAISLWRLVFSQNEPAILDRWLDYLEKHSEVRGIPKDTWDMFLNFTEVVGEDLSTYDDTEAWPSLFDDFVEYENDYQNQNVTEKDEKDQRGSFVE